MNPGIRRTAIAVVIASMLGAVPARAEFPATVLHRFTGYSEAVGPQAGLLLAPDGNYYGIRSGGGSFLAGTLFRLTPAGVVIPLFDFPASAAGWSHSALTLGPDGALFGTMWSSHTTAAFRVALDGSSYQVLHVFDPEGEGYWPGEFVLGDDGQFYGTLGGGGPIGYGAVYRMAPGGSVTVLHTFAGYPTDASAPTRLAKAIDGGFFGLSVYGGVCEYSSVVACNYSGRGTLFHITPAGAVTILHAFLGGPGDGALPTDLIVRADGGLYGTTYHGGGPCAYSSCGDGALFEWTSTGGYRVLTLMDGNPTSLLQTSDGTLYGTLAGGDPECLCGGIFRIGPDGAPATIHAFDSLADGQEPNRLVEGRDGALYGTTLTGGIGYLGFNWSFGTVFRIERTGAFQVLHRFPGGDEGAQSDSLIQASDGNFYGTTLVGGAYNRGTVYRMTPLGAVQVLHTFSGGVDGSTPNGIVQGSDGFLYGTTWTTGAANQGTAFRMSLNGDFVVIHAFVGPGPSHPDRLIQGAGALLYGVSAYGGALGGGTVFAMTPAGAVTVVHDFPIGAYPHGSLVLATDGYLYGMATRSVFRVSPSGAYAVVHDFTGAETYLRQLAEGRDGGIYGINVCRGEVFRVTRAGTYEVVTSALGSDCGDSGFEPVSISTDRHGNLLVYGDRGVPRTGFPPSVEGDCGRLSSLGVDGTLTPLHQFMPCRDGATPSAILHASDGMFYVAMAYGGFGSRGELGGGTIVRLDARVPLQPRFGVATAGPGGARLSWTGVGGAASYTIIRHCALSAPVVVAQGLAATTFVDADPPPPALECRYEVFAVNAYGESVPLDMAVTRGAAGSRTPTVSMVADYDGDGKSDLAVYRRSGEWFIAPSGTPGTVRSIAWGVDDRPVPADYDGDGKADIAVYRENTGEWFILRSRATPSGWTLTFGAPAFGDVPVPADYDGDRRADVTVFRPSTGQWFILHSTTGLVETVQWGANDFGDVPVPADYDGDGRRDLAVYRTSTGEWFIRYSSGGAAHVVFGQADGDDVPLPGDYGGIGRATLAVYRASTAEWFIAGIGTFRFGAPELGDVPVPGDYDGDGKTDIAIYRSKFGRWFRPRVDRYSDGTPFGAPALGDAVRIF
jgi:uncharacterized repeat protein (TIGR03803 family)